MNHKIQFSSVIWSIRSGSIINKLNMGAQDHFVNTAVDYIPAHMCIYFSAEHNVISFLEDIECLFLVDTVADLSYHQELWLEWVPISVPLFKDMFVH